MVGGRLRPRTDEFPLKLWERHVIPGSWPGHGVRPLPSEQPVTGVARAVPDDARRDPGHHLRALRASGRFPRTAIEEVHEDRALVNRVRTLTSAYGSRRDVVVFGSVRRLRAYGLAGTLAWYADHGHHPDVVDVRGVA